MDPGCVLVGILHSVAPLYRVDLDRSEIEVQASICVEVQYELNYESYFLLPSNEVLKKASTSNEAQACHVQYF